MLSRVCENSTNFVGEQKTDCFQRLFTSINIVAKKQILGVRWKAATFEVTKQIRILTMNIAY
jgi:hypothetical protein